MSTQAPLQPARLFGALRAAALLCGSALSCCVAACGVALLLFLLVTRTLAPAAAHFQRDLYFDYTSPDVVAVASFLFTGAAASEPPFVKVRRRQQYAAVPPLFAAPVVQIYHEAPFHEAQRHANSAEGVACPADCFKYMLCLGFNSKNVTHAHCWAAGPGGGLGAGAHGPAARAAAGAARGRVAGAGHAGEQR